MANDFSQYLTDPSSGFDLGSLLGMGGGGGGSMDFLTGGLGGLFGGNSSSFKPYIDENGQYVWNQPTQGVPVPVSTVPGSSYKPSKSYREQQRVSKLSLTYCPTTLKLLRGK